MGTAAAHFATWWRNTRHMPWLLRQICQGGMLAGPILLFFVLLPLADYRINGRSMSYSEFWFSGAGASAALFVSLIIVGCWGLAARRPNSRWALVAAPLAPYAPLVVFPSSFVGDVTAADVLLACLTAAVIYVCLFYPPSIRRYLEGEIAGDRSLSV